MITFSISDSEAVTLSSILDRELGSISRGLDECLDGKTPATQRALESRQRDARQISLTLRVAAKAQGLPLCDMVNR